MRAPFSLSPAIAVLSLVLAGPASAQSLYGPSGLFLNPSASLPPRDQLTPSVLVLPQKHPSDATRTWISGTLDYGLTDDIEVGFTYLEVTNWKDTGSFGGFGKFRLLKESKTRPAVAVGATQLAFGDFDTRTIFVAGRKEVYSIQGRHPVILHGGGQYFDRLDGIKRQSLRPFGGVEIGLDSHFSFVGEARAKMTGDVETPWGLTVLYRPNDQWRFAVTWSNNGQSTDPRFGFGAGLTLGSRR